MARKKKEETAIPEASVRGTPREAAETPQESAAAETGKDTTPATETQDGQPVADVEAVPEGEPMVKGRLDLEDLSSMDTPTLQKLAQDMGLTVPDPEDRDALLDAITAEEVSAPAREEPEPERKPPGAVPEDTPEGFTPYSARVKPGLLVFRSQPDGEPVGTLRRGTEVRVAARAGEYARLENGIFVKEALLSPV